MVWDTYILDYVRGKYKQSIYPWFSSPRKYYCYRRLVGDPSETNNMTDEWPTCMIGDRLVRSEIGLFDRRPTCSIGDRHAWLDTGMPDWRPIGHAWSDMLVSDQACWSPSRHVDLPLVYDHACWFPMDLPSDMSVSIESSMGLQWVSDGSLVGLHWVFDNDDIFVNSFLTFWIPGTRKYGFELFLPAVQHCKLKAQYKIDR